MTQRLSAPAPNRNWVRDPQDGKWHSRQWSTDAIRDALESGAYFIPGNHDCEPGALQRIMAELAQGVLA